MKNRLRVCAYCRVSSDRDEQVNSLDSQRRYFKEYIENREGWVLGEIYYDEGISGTMTKKRDNFNRMINDALRGDIDLILTKEVSRFARNTVDTLSYTRKLKEHGVGVIFTIDNIDTRESDGELRLTIMASLAQEESRKTSERVKWGQRRQMEKGVVFGRDLLGYTVKNGVLTINEQEVPIVKAIFHKFTNEGKGTHVIARELIEEGMRPKRISLWNNTVILRALRNEKYVGDLCQKKTITPNYLTHQKKYNYGEEEMVYIQNHHEPIIERELWNRTQKELKRREPSEKQKAKHSNRYWCSGKLVCGICGRSFVGRTKKLSNGLTYKAWRCYAAANHGRLKIDADGEYIGCENQSYNEKALISIVRYCVLQLQMNRENLKQEILAEIKALSNMKDNKINKAHIEKEIENVKQKKRKVVDLLLTGIISKEDAKDQNEWYDSQIIDLEKKLLSCEESERVIRNQADEMGKYIEALDDIIGLNINDVSTLKQEHGEEPELFFREIIDKIVLFPQNKVHVYFSGIPFIFEVEIKNSGRNEEYSTEIVSMTVLSNS